MSEFRVRFRTSFSLRLPPEGPSRGVAPSLPGVGMGLWTRNDVNCKDARCFFLVEIMNTISLDLVHFNEKKNFFFYVIYGAICVA